MWWESTILVSLYFGYWILMFQNAKIMKFVKHIIEDRLNFCQRIKNFDIANQKPFEKNNDVNGNSIKPVKLSKNGQIVENYTTVDCEKVEKKEKKIEKKISRTDLVSCLDEFEERDDNFNLWTISSEKSRFQKFWFYFTLPIRTVLFFTIPSPVKYQRLFVVSFAMCIVWIGCISYMVFWMVILIGDAFNIPGKLSKIS